MNISKYQNNNM